MTKDLRDTGDAFDESEAIADEDRVTLVDDNDVEHDFVILALIEYDGGEYALLTPEAELDVDEGEIELFVFHYELDETGQEHFVPIEDEATFQRVTEFCATMIRSDQAQESPPGGIVGEA